MKMLLSLMRLHYVKEFRRSRAKFKISREQSEKLKPNEIDLSWVSALSCVNTPSSKC